MSITELSPADRQEIRGKTPEEQISDIAQVFFDTIDEAEATEGGPIHLAYFVLGAPTHDDVRKALVDGVEELCKRPASNCVLIDKKAQDERSQDELEPKLRERIVLQSRKSGNRLVEVAQVYDGEVYGYAYSICGENQNPPF